MLVGWLISEAVPSDGRLGIFQNRGRVRVRGSTAFFPTPQRGEGKMKIIFLQDRDGRTLRKSIAFAPSCQLVHREVNIASSDLGGKRSASFELLSLCQLLKALAFFL
jgi:hypothetical protein